MAISPSLHNQRPSFLLFDTQPKKYINYALILSSKGGVSMPKSEKKSSTRTSRKAAASGSKKPSAKAGPAEGMKKQQRRTRSSLPQRLPGQRKATVHKPAEIMPETKAPGKSPFEALRKKYLKTVCKVTFNLPKQAVSFASKVNLVGDFNSWNREATPMKRRRDGSFSVTLSLPTARAYHFRYLIDGYRWENDWCADTYMPNPYAGENSVVIV
jgi:hypothetical protein